LEEGSGAGGGGGLFVGKVLLEGLTGVGWPVLPCGIRIITSGQKKTHRITHASRGAAGLMATPRLIYRGLTSVLCVNVDSLQGTCLVCKTAVFRLESICGTLARVRFSASDYSRTIVRKT